MPELRSIPCEANAPGLATVLPVTVALYGLGSHDAFLRTGNQRYYRQMMCALRWLENHCVPLGEGIGWTNDISESGLKAPWFSGMVQGVALSLFVRAHQLNGAGPWSRLAHQTWLGYHLPVEQGGFCRKVSLGVIYEEYPTPQLDCTFNGVCRGLIGLWEAGRSAIVPDAEADFNLGLKGLRSYLAQFDHSGWSLYSLNQCLGRPFLASPYYQRCNAVLAQVVGLMAEEPEFVRYGRRWQKSSRSIVRRIGFSIRIGLDRYMRAPSLLQSDISKNQ